MEKSGSRAKIDDVAHLAGVSTKTVSRVLNNEPNVRDATRVKVKEAAEELNYTPDFSARSLAGQKSYLIAMFYDTAAQGYLSQFQASALVQCREYGYHLIVERCDITAPNGGQELANTAARLRVDGVVLLPPLSNQTDVLDHLGQTQIPFVQVAPSETSKASHFLDMDDARAAYELTGYLIALGHRRIGHIMGHPAHGATVQRYEGYCQALKDAGLAYEPELVTEGLFTISSGETGAEALLSASNPPSAIFAANDDMAAGAIMRARERGLQIPRDVSVVGFDDSEIAIVTYPQLTTVRQPIEGMAGSAIDLLIDAIKTSKSAEVSNATQSRQFGFELIERGSAGRPKPV